MYAASVDGTVALRLGHGHWTPGGTETWLMAVSGLGFAVWEKVSGCNISGQQLAHDSQHQLLRPSSEGRAASNGSVVSFAT